MAQLKNKFLAGIQFDTDEQGRLKIYSDEQMQQFQSQREAIQKIERANQLKLEIQTETNNLLAQYAKEKQGFETKAKIGKVAQFVADPRMWAKGVWEVGKMVTENPRDVFIGAPRGALQSKEATKLYEQSAALNNEATRLAQTDKAKSEELLRQSQELYNTAQEKYGKAVSNLGELTTGKQIAAKSALAGLDIGSFLPGVGAIKGGVTATQATTKVATKVPAAIQTTKLTGRANLLSNALGLGDIYQGTQVAIKQGLGEATEQTLRGQAARAAIQGPVYGTLEVLADEEQEDTLGNIVKSSFINGITASGLTLGFGWVGRALVSKVAPKAGTMPELPTPPDTGFPQRTRAEEIKRIQGIEADFLARTAEPTQAAMPKVVNSIQQAKTEGKTFDDWVKTQGQIVYRGEYKRPQKVNTGISTSLSKDVATSFSESGNVSEMIIPKNANIIDISTLRKQILGVEEFPDTSSLTKEQFNSITGQRLVDYAKEQGYDVIDHTKVGVKSSGIKKGKILDEQEMQVINPEILKTRQQLETEWNAGQTNIEPTPTQDPIKQSLGAFDPETTIPMLDLTKTVKGNNIDFNPDSALSVNSARKVVDDIALLNGMQVGGKSLQIDKNDPKYQEIYNTQIKPLIDKINAVDEVAPVEVDEITKSIQQAKAEGKTFNNWLKNYSLYHGTPTNIKSGKLQFNVGEGIKKGGQSGGLFLSDNPNVSRVFGENIYQASSNIKKEVLDLTKVKNINKFKKEINKTYLDMDGEKIVFTEDDFNLMFPNGKADFASISQYPELVEKIVKKENLRGIAFDEYAGGEIGKTYQILEGEVPIKTKSELKAQWNAVEPQPQVNKIPAEEVELEVNKIYNTLENEGFNIVPEKVVDTPAIDAVDDKLTKGDQPTAQEMDASMKELADTTGDPEVIAGVKQELNTRKKESTYAKRVVSANPELDRNAIVQYDVANMAEAQKYADDLVANNFDKAKEIAESIDTSKIVDPRQVKVTETYTAKLLELGRYDEASDITANLSRALTKEGQSIASVRNSNIADPVSVIRKLNNERQTRFTKEIQTEVAKVKEQLNNVVIDKDAIIEILDNITCR